MLSDYGRPWGPREELHSPVEDLLESCINKFPANITTDGISVAKIEKRARQLLVVSLETGKVWGSILYAVDLADTIGLTAVCYREGEPEVSKTMPKPEGGYTSAYINDYLTYFIIWISRTTQGKEVKWAGK